MLDIQAVLESHYPDLARRHRRTTRTLGRFLSLLFHQSRFQQFEKDYPHLEGFDFVEETLRYFDFNLRLREGERARIPASGRVVIAANHPIGSLDGLALLNLVRQVRPDVKVVANELLTAVKPLHPVLLPVNNMGGNTARANLRNIRAHLEDEGALIIFRRAKSRVLARRASKTGNGTAASSKLPRRHGHPYCRYSLPAVIRCSSTACLR